MERIASLDYYKLFLSLFVVGIHCSLFSDVDGKLAFIFDQGIFRIAVPSFILISGFYFDSINNKERLMQWCSRLIILFVFWTLVYFPFWNVEPKVLIKLIFVLNGYAHLWYIVHMLLAGIVLYYLKDKKWFKPLPTAFALFFVGCVIEYSAVYSFNEKVDTFFRFIVLSYRNFAFVCLPLLIIGYSIKKHGFKISKVAFLFVVFLFLIEILLNAQFSYRYPNPIFDIQFSLILITPLLFMAVKEIKIDSSYGKLISFISSSIYFTHLFIINLLTIYGIQSTVYKWILTIVISLLMAFPIQYLNSKLKYKIL
ncbi:acyltransferase family protein [Sphingobacterium sp. DK4209]|uniref:Acyltransferase family protein n=1 Tax=Sphingobacterium zhuxiongii TaxID=2662364 RepID=A0A5Q0Q9Q0_9SPHI|nr:acyltransferase family protein [Sphingobacterium sp. DK4209]QGA26827.1 acyltransferase family protein [Sphingobacterium sp. dk4302]